MRPTQTYEHVFDHPREGSVFRVKASGRTPCEARAKARRRLGRHLAERPGMTATGWDLREQRRLREGE